MYIRAQNIAETYNKILNEFFTQYKQIAFKLFIYIVYYIFFSIISLIMKPVSNIF